MSTRHSYWDLPGLGKERLAAGAKELPAFRPAPRIQESLTSGAEKKLLVWLAERLPAQVNSDHLTALGAAAMLLAGASYAVARFDPRALALASLFIALNWLGDSLDGTLARVRNCQRPRYGFYVDHVLDTFGAFFLMGGLALSGYVHPGIALGMLIAFLMLSAEVYLATYTLGSFHMSFWRFGPTEIRLCLIAGNLALLRWPTAHLFGHAFRLFDVGGAVATAGMGAMLVVSAARHIAKLYREEPLP
ncbi:MAG TPA: CDP-alcohol phosphatidyltransferase family protein [Terriglobales bacterium]|nr:CDP-alcohol phosphatidyltransferase family protein [Terriglobales bacterium]